jgi:hypothetical protein
MDLLKIVEIKTLYIFTRTLSTCTQNYEDQSQKSNIINIKLYSIDTFKKLSIFIKIHYLLRLRFTGKLL